MDRQGKDRIMHSAGVRKGGNASQSSVAHQERKEGMAQASFFQMREKKEQIHGHGAKLKRKIPPVIVSAIYAKGQIDLFPDLTCRHQKTAGQEEIVKGGLRFCMYVIHKVSSCLL